MAAIDYKNLSIDARIERQYRICGRCGHEMAVTTFCPIRKNRENPWVCWHCCWNCSYAIDAPGGKGCGIKARRAKRRRERAQKVKSQKAKRQHDERADYSFFDMEGK